MVPGKPFNSKNLKTKLPFLFVSNYYNNFSGKFLMFDLFIYNDFCYFL